MSALQSRMAAIRSTTNALPLPTALSTRETVLVVNGRAVVTYTGSKGESNASVIHNAIHRTMSAAHHTGR